MEIYQGNKTTDNSARLSSACFFRFLDNGVVDFFFFVWVSILVVVTLKLLLTRSTSPGPGRAMSHNIAGNFELVPRELIMQIWNNYLIGALFISILLAGTWFLGVSLQGIWTFDWLFSIYWNSAAWGHKQRELNDMFMHFLSVPPNVKWRHWRESLRTRYSFPGLHETQYNGRMSASKTWRLVRTFRGYEWEPLEHRTAFGYVFVKNICCL